MRVRLVVLFVLSVLLVLGCGKAPQEAALKYHCPMHPDYVSDKPGDCPICGMSLVPMEGAKQATETPTSAETAETPVPGMAPVEMDEQATRLSGVQTAVAERRALSRSTRAVGLVTADESRVRHVHTKTSGRRLVLMRPRAS